MSYSFDPDEPLDEQCRSVLHERLELAIDAVTVAGRVDGGVEFVQAVHAARKRCKESRALARLIRPSTSDEWFVRFDRGVGQAAAELSSLRDAHAVLQVFDRLCAVAGFDREDLDDEIAEMRLGHVRDIERASVGAGTVDSPLERARRGLTAAADGLDGLDGTLDRIDDDVAIVVRGVRASYGAARRRHRRLVDEPSDELAHRWRTSVKRLWYHLRLLDRAAPSMLSPLVRQLDELGEALGEDHDLTVLVGRLESRADRDRPDAAARLVETARLRQHELRARAVRIGASLLAERPASFADRIGRYWTLAVASGPEPATGGAIDAGQLGPAGSATAGGPPSGESIERERKFLVDGSTELPAPTGGEVQLRQGYLAVDGDTSVRVRQRGPEEFSMTVKSGRGAVRTEIEFPLTEEQFRRAWEHTHGRRIHKTRSTVTAAGRSIEVDVFHGALDGLVVAEVEFDDDDSMRDFRPPEWFEDEVTDDPAYTNAALASSAMPPDELDSDAPWRPPSGPRREVGG